MRRGASSILQWGHCRSCPPVCGRPTIEEADRGGIAYQWPSCAGLGGEAQDSPRVATVIWELPILIGMR